MDEGFVPVVEPGAVRHAPSKGASPELARVTLVGSFMRLLKFFFRVFRDKSNSLAVELIFPALLMYDVDILSWDEEK